MTIIELLNLNPEGLEAMSNEELAKHLAPYIQDKRPAAAISGGRSDIKAKNLPNRTELIELLKQIKKGS